MSEKDREGEERKEGMKDRRKERKEERGEGEETRFDVPPLKILPILKRYVWSKGSA